MGLSEVIPPPQLYIQFAISVTITTVAAKSRFRFPFVFCGVGAIVSWWSIVFVTISKVSTWEGSYAPGFITHLLALSITFVGLAIWTAFEIANEPV